MNVNLIFFRHGETDWNKDYLVQGISDIPLNETGLNQAKELASSLKDKAINAIISSDLVRAKQTAEAVLKEQNDDVSIHSYEGLREINYGVAEGAPRKETREKYADILKIIDDFQDERSDTISLPGGESREEVISRVLDAIHKYLEHDKTSSTVAVSTHGGVIGALCRHLKGERRSFSNCETLEMVYDRQSRTLKINE